MTFRPWAFARHRGAEGIGATALSVDTGKTLLVDGQAVIDAANAAGIAIVGREVNDDGR